MNLKFTHAEFKLEYNAVNAGSFYRTWPKDLVKSVIALVAFWGLLNIIFLFVPIPRFYPTIGFMELWHPLVAMVVCFIILPPIVVGTQAFIAWRLGYHIQTIRAGIFSLYYQNGKYKFRLVPIDSNRSNGAVFPGH